MNHTLAMMLEWARTDRDFRNIAWGYYLATPDLAPVEAQYFENICNARMQGISA